MKLRANPRSMHHGLEVNLWKEQRGSISISKMKKLMNLCKGYPIFQQKIRK